MGLTPVARTKQAFEKQLRSKKCALKPFGLTLICNPAAERQPSNTEPNLFLQFRLELCDNDWKAIAYNKYSEIMYQPLLKSKAIYKYSPGLGVTLISITIFILIFLGMFIFAITSKGAAFIYLSTLFGVMSVPLVISIKLILRSRRVKKLLKRRRYLAAIGTDFVTYISRTVAHSEFEGKDNEIYFSIIDDQVLIGQPVWPMSVSNEKAAYRIYDFKAEIYQRTRYGRSKVADKYYTILEIKLRKPVPHLVFDSKTANKQQFKSIYVSAQKLEAAANFDEYFTLYSPKHHSIETLSFITPEVIEAMIDLRDCDFEFIGDSLLCYAPLLDEAELVGLRQRGLLLHAKVNDNLRRYTLTAEQIDEFGRQLLKNPWRTLPITIGFSLIASALWVSLIFFEFDFETLFYALGLTVLVVLGIFTIIRTRRKNQQLEEQFLQRKTQGKV